MQLKILLLGFILGLLSMTVMAGGNHDHGHSHSHTQVTQTVAQTKATEIVAALVKRKKLENSWSSIVASSIETKTFNGNPEWLAIFVNTKITDTDKQKLYIFLTLGGDYIAANFTGK